MVKNAKYTPILKWKDAERSAIKDLSNSQKDALLPLFEFIRPTKISKAAQKLGVKSIEDEIATILSAKIPQDILLSWGDGRQFFADFTLIEPVEARAKFSANFIQNSCTLFLKPIPVVNVSADSDEYLSSIITQSIMCLESQICVRFSSADFSDTGALAKKLTAFCNKYKLTPRNISLLIDLKEDISTTSFEKAISALKGINSTAEYENIVIASGAFPKDMSMITIEDDRHDRTDWLNWKKYRSMPHGLPRYPSFADYTIRHPIYNEQIALHRATATIKYTLHSEWRFFKGKRNKYEVCLANASVFRMDNDFFGRDYSAGDKYIDDKGLYFAEYVKQVNENPTKKIGGTGNAPTWIRASINHHIAVVVDQIANLGE
jgi:hypothetical protein